MAEGGGTHIRFDDLHNKEDTGDQSCKLWRGERIVIGVIIPGRDLITRLMMTELTYRDNQPMLQPKSGVTNL